MANICRLRHRDLRRAGQCHFGDGGQTLRGRGAVGSNSSVAVNVTGQLAEFADGMSFSSTGLGVVLALIVLLLVFGSIYAALLPILSALFALGTAIGVIELLSHVIGMPQFAADLDRLDRSGGGRRLRALHRDPTSTGTGSRTDTRGLHRQRGQHLWSGRPVRRHHRVHRTARDVRAWASVSCTAWPWRPPLACSSP